MGMFSWKCCKSGISIANKYQSDVWNSECYLITPHGAIYEQAYEGYGEYGGHDIFELLGNGDRDLGHERYYFKRDELPFAPKFVIAAYYQGESYEELEESEECPDQGHFYDMDYTLQVLGENKFNILYRDIICKESDMKVDMYDDKPEPTTIIKEWEKPFDYKKAIELVEERKDKEIKNAINHEHYRMCQMAFDKRYDLPNYVIGITLMTEKGEGKIAVFDGVKEKGNNLIDESDIEDILYTPTNILYQYPLSQAGYDKSIEVYEMVIETAQRNYHEIYWLSELDVRL